MSNNIANDANEKFSQLLVAVTLPENSRVLRHVKVSSTAGVSLCQAQLAVAVHQCLHCKKIRAVTEYRCTTRETDLLQSEQGWVSCVRLHPEQCASARHNAASVEVADAKLLKKMGDSNDSFRAQSSPNT
jgi:hypothetical protein